MYMLTFVDVHGDLLWYSKTDTIPQIGWRVDGAKNPESRHLNVYRVKDVELVYERRGVSSDWRNLTTITITLATP